MRPYAYIGNPEFIPLVEFPPRTQLTGPESLSQWMHEHRDQMDVMECIPATFVVDTEYRFWIADRSSEHVACARVQPVLSAGEVFFSGLESAPSIERITNQSTGYCPEPESWEAVERALSETGIRYPETFEPVFIFRRCEGCGTLAIVKDEEFTCLECGRDLPRDRNLDQAEEA